MVEVVMPRNKKSERMLVARWELERSFVELIPKFEICSRLLFLFITSSDKLSRKNVLYSEAYLDRFRNNEAFQKDALFESRVLQLGDALRRAKDRLTNRESKRVEKKEIKMRQELRKAKNEPPSAPVPAIEPSSIWAAAVEKREKNNE
jgi:hypothetical protein